MTTCLEYILSFHCIYVSYLQDDKEEEDDDEEEEDEDEEEEVTAGSAKKRPAGAEADAMDEAKMADIMMTRKNRKLYARINRAQQGKRERVEVLEERKKRATEKK